MEPFVSCSSKRALAQSNDQVDAASCAEVLAADGSGYDVEGLPRGNS